MWGRRESYGAVAATITVWVLVSAATSLLRPLIPAEENLAMTTAPGDYLKLASHQRIRWQPLSDLTFVEAKRSQKAVLLAIGAGWSTAAREFDQAIFSDLEVAERINRDLIPIRIDYINQPDWRNAYLPLSRASMGADPGFQIYLVDSNGQLVAWLNPPRNRERLDAYDFLANLKAAQEEHYHKKLSRVASEQAFEATQLINVGKVATPNVGEFVRYLGLNIDTVRGGFHPKDDRAYWPIQDWKLLLSLNDLATLKASIDPRLGFTMVNWLDGGVFHFEHLLPERHVEFETLPSESAEAMSFLAAYGTRAKNPLATLIASRTFDSLSSMFANQLPAYLYSPMESNRRSERYSVSRRRFADSVNADDQTWAVMVFGLSIRYNPQLIPYAREAQMIVESPERTNESLGQIRSTSPANVLERGTEFTMPVGAGVINCLIKTAVALDDPSRLAQALDLRFALDPLVVSKSDVIHSQVKEGLPQRYLSDYLAFSELCLTLYTVTGEPEHLSHGKLVLNRALELFMVSGLPYENLMQNYGTSPLPFRMPPIVDQFAPSSAALLLELLTRYGQIYKDDKMAEMVTKLSERLSPVANGMPRGVASFFLASIQARDGRIMFTTGRDAVGLARRLAFRDPGLAVVPLSGSLRPDIQAKGNGVFLVQHSQVLGPLKIDEAADLLFTSSVE